MAVSPTDPITFDLEVFYIYLTSLIYFGFYSLLKFRHKYLFFKVVMWNLIVSQYVTNISYTQKF